MDDDPSLPLPSRGFVLIEAFCQASGLDVREVDELVIAGRIAGGYAEPHQLTGMFADELPTRQQLIDWGFSVPDSYSPDALRPREVSAPPGWEDGAPRSSEIRW